MHRASAVLVFVFGSVTCLSTNLPAQAFPSMTKFVVIPRSEDLSLSPARGAFALSPDGEFLAYLRIQNTPAAGRSEPDLVQSRNRTSIEVFDTRSARKLFTYSLPEYEVRSQSWNAWNTRTVFLHYCDNGQYLVASYEYGEIYVLDTRQYHAHAILDLKSGEAGLHQDEPSHAIDPGPNFAQAVCAASGDMVAFRLWNYSGSSSVRAFVLDTGKEIGLPLQFPNSGTLADLAISPYGSRVAIWGSKDTLEIFDLQKNQVTLIPVAEEIARMGVTCFVGEWMIALRQSGLAHEPVPDRPMVPAFSKNPDPSTFLSWDVRTGAVAITNIDPDARGAGFLDVSADGRVVLSDTGKASWCYPCNRGSHMVKIDYSQVTLWNRETGQAIAQSPHLPPVHHKCPLIPDVFECDSWDEAPELELSANGNAVLAYWPSGGKPVEVFFAPSPSSRH